MKLLTSREQAIQYAKEKLQETDWAVLEDITTLQNKDEFIAFRRQMRDLVINPVENIVVPDVPKAIWK